MSRIYSAEELEVCEEVGRGGFGVVFRGILKSSGVEVAIKQIDLESEQTDLFEINKEIQIISDCRLPQIIEYLGCFVKNYKLWIIMEFVDGGSLFEVLRPGSVTDEQLVLMVIKEILLALDYLHGQGKIHRDLKSQNILLSGKGCVKLTDFGVLTQLSSNFSRRNTTVGTPYWMAPEVILNNHGGHSYKADIWSLGCCAYEMYTGKPPLQSNFPPMKALRQISRCHKSEDYINLIGLLDLLMLDLFKDFLLKCFIMNPKERWSASRLLKHEFITLHERDETLLKKLITKKRLWDQENHVPRKQNVYVPTDIAKNQQKWNFDSDEELLPVKFDFSLIKDSPRGSSSLPEVKERSKKSTRELKTSERSQEQLRKLKSEFERTLNKIFHKMETKNSLSTRQYDNLVSLNRSFLSLVDYLDGDKKVVIFQYLKYLLKDITKADSEQGGRLVLLRLIIPSNFSVHQVSRESHIKEFDEIEQSLLESWVEKMNDRRRNTENGSKDS